MTVSNAERLYIHYQKLFLELDHVKVAKKLHLMYDDGHIYVPFFNRSLSINRFTADITCPLYKNSNFFREKLLVLHHLYFHKHDAENSGDMVAFRELRECSNFEPAYRKMTLEPLAAHFDRKVCILRERALDIGGQMDLCGGDVSFSVKAFPLISLQFIFWNGDDEFPANASIMFDKNIAQFIHPESISVLADVCVKILMENS